LHFLGASSKKIDAIYELREAAEEKALAERRVDEHPSAHNRDELLDKQLKLEDKTLNAITACHDCGHPHDASEPHVKGS
jgi:hypothetical protein